MLYVHIYTHTQVLSLACIKPHLFKTQIHIAPQCPAGPSPPPRGQALQGLQSENVPGLGSTALLT